MRVIAGEVKGHKLKGTDRKTTRAVTDRIKESIFGILGDISGKRVLDLFAGTGSIGIESLSRGAREVIFIDRDRKCVKLIKENLLSISIPLTKSSLLWGEVSEERGNKISFPTWGEEQGERIPCRDMGFAENLKLVPNVDSPGVYSCENRGGNDRKRGSLNLHAIVYTSDVKNGLKRLGRSGEKFDLIFVDPPFGSSLVEETLKDIERFKLVSGEGIVIARHHNKQQLPEKVDELHLSRRKKYGEDIVCFYEQGR